MRYVAGLYDFVSPLAQYSYSGGGILKYFTGIKY